jgi:hypothetical protein
VGNFGACMFWFVVVQYRISTVTCSCFFFGACTLSLSNTRIYIRRRIPVGTEKINLPVDQTRDASNIHR